MELLSHVVIERPETCYLCPFGFEDSDEGSMCCRSRRDEYGINSKNGNMLFYTIESPQEALDHDCSCMFVKSATDLSGKCKQ